MKSSIGAHKTSVSDSSINQPLAGSGYEEEFNNLKEIEGKNGFPMPGDQLGN